MNRNLYKKEEFTYSPKISDKFVYIFAFLIGLLILTLGSILFIAPLISLTGGLSGSTIEEMTNNLTEKITVYQGFLSLIPEMIGVALICVVFRKLLINDGKRLIKDWLRNIIIIAVSTGLIIAFSYLFDYIYSKTNVDPSSENQTIIENILSSKGRFSMIIQVALVAPIFEEFIFRKFTFGYLDTTKLHIAINTFIVAFIFAIIHCTGEDFSQGTAYLYLLNYFTLSLILTFAFVFSKKNIYVSILVHMINNIISLVALCGVLNVIL